jgi:rRNA maturation endonuclease Nob1
MPGKTCDKYISHSHQIVYAPDDDPNHWAFALRCTVCLEYFHEPRCLPCGHTFCKKYVRNFLGGNRKKI